MDQIKLKTNKGAKIEFRDHAFLRDYLLDDSNRIVLKKCLDPKTRILTSDLKWIEIENLKLGDSLIGFNEKIPEGTTKERQGTRRKYLETKVLNKWETEKEAFELILEDGRKIIASDNHPFLGKKRSLSTWKIVKDFKVGDPIKVLFKVWKSDRNYEDGWMAGFMDGEASLKPYRKSGGTDFVISQRPGKLSDRAEKYLERYKLKFHKRDDYHMGDLIHRNGPVRRLVLSRLTNVMFLLGQTQTKRWIDSQFWVNQYFGFTEPGPFLKIKSIKSLGKRRMIDIETSSHTFIAEGLATHNCTQIGVSFTSLIKILYKGDKENLSIIYTLPTASDVKDFVKTKFEPMINSSEVLKNKVEKDELSRRLVYSTLLKRIGGSHYFFKGSWTERSAQTIDADLLAVDELDFQKPDIRTMYEERLEGSGSKDIIYWMGVPSLPNYGIAEIYDTSDQREWFIECPECKRRQTLTWPENISFKKKTYICKHCRYDLSDEVRRKGIWIPKYPEREIHGYYFNRLMAPWISAPKIISAYHKQKRKHFYNYTLGQPYLEESQQFQKTEFNSACLALSQVELLKGQKRICGIDQGNRFHVIAGLTNEDVAVVTRAQICDNMEELEGVIKTLKPDMIVMDRFPDQHYARKLQQAFGKTKFLLINQRDWSESRKMQDHIDLDRSTGLINLERTEALDRMFDRIRSQENGLRYLNSLSRLEEVYEHLRNLVPDYQERFGRNRKVYKKIGPEDFAHASNYFLIGSEILFPELRSEKTQTVPCAIAQDFIKGTDDWIKADFEKRMRDASCTEDTIIIPPKRI